MRSDEGLDCGLVEIADGDHGHQIGPVPVRVELPEPVGGGVLDDFGPADRQPFRVARALEQDGKLRILYSLVSAEPEPPFLEDDAPLLVDLHGIERHVLRPIFEDEQRSVDHGGVAGGNLQLVHGFVKAGMGVDVRAEAHAERLHEAADVLPRKVQCAVEGHVLDEVREPALVLILEHGAGIDDEPKLGTGLGLSVLADVIAEPVRERADRNQRIDRNGLAERGRQNVGRDGRLLRAGEASGRHDRRQEQRQSDTSGKSHRAHLMHCPLNQLT